MTPEPVSSIVARMTKAWALPRRALQRGQLTHFELSCTVRFGPAAGTSAMVLPPDVASLWSAVAEARLFEDSVYGQWGLVLLEPAAAKRASSDLRKTSGQDWLNGDLILGEFLGDSDQLLVRCDQAKPDFGNILIVQPIERRAEWPRVAPSLGEFLLKYEQEQGAKFWESNPESDLERDS